MIAFLVPGLATCHRIGDQTLAAIYAEGVRITV
jgi:hypothetical protein